MHDCDFCAGRYVPGKDTQCGIRLPFQAYLSMCANRLPDGLGVWLKDGCLTFDNSCGEYEEGAVRIRYCPFCGAEIKQEEDD